MHIPTLLLVSLKTIRNSYFPNQLVNWDDFRTRCEIVKRAKRVSQHIVCVNLLFTNVRYEKDFMYWSVKITPIVSKFSLTEWKTIQIYKWRSRIYSTLILRQHCQLRIFWHYNTENHFLWVPLIESRPLHPSSRL